MIVGIFGDWVHFTPIHIRLVTKKENHKNRILVNYDDYKQIPGFILNECSIYVYNTSENQLDVPQFHSIDFLFENNIENTFILGNDLIFSLFNKIDRIESYNLDFYSDKLLRLMTKDFIETETCNLSYHFKSWERKPHSEYNYLNLLQKVIQNGSSRQTRNAETLSLFGESVEFDLQDGFPLLTTKKMFFTGIVKELLWFLNGKTNANELKNDGVHIWDGNTTREFLDSCGLNHYKEGCAGPIYGYQWRNFNAPYDVETMMPKKSGFDQLMFCIQELQNNPTSRRMVMSGWNPCQMKEMCLPPCHVLYQFYVEKDRLSCQMYQRSADLFLGLPFNIASTALLVCLLAKITGYIPGRIKICIGDAHIYKTHIDNILVQLKRTPMPYCKIEIDHFVSDPEEQIRSWKSEHIKLIDYNSHGRLSALMVA